MLEKKTPPGWVGYFELAPSGSYFLLLGFNSLFNPEDQLVVK